MSSDSSKPYGDAILGAFLIMLLTFSGVFLTAASGCNSKWNNKSGRLFRRVMIPSFAAGALLATSALLLIPESLHLLEEQQLINAELHAAELSGAVASEYDDHSDHDGHEDHIRRLVEFHADHDHFRRLAELYNVTEADEHDHEGELHEGEAGPTWKFGSCLLGGFLFPILLHVFFPNRQDDDKEDSNENQQGSSAYESRQLLEQQQNNKESNDSGKRNAKTSSDLKATRNNSLAGGTSNATTDVVTKSGALESKADGAAAGGDAKSTSSTEVNNIPFACDVGECGHNHLHNMGNEEDDVEQKNLVVIDGEKCEITDTSEKQKKTSIAAVNLDGDDNDDDEEEEEQEKKTEKKKRINVPLAASILLGDFLHNFTDGVFIGNALILCDRDIAFTMVATTIYHEIAQELADYVILTEQCGLPVWKALLANFLSGFSVMIGAILILSLDLSKEGTGCIMAIAAGVYLYITAVECIPKIRSGRKNAVQETLLFFFFFLLGAVPIGLVLINHGHCDG